MAGEKILIIEDDADIRELIRYNLVREGYRVSEAVDGKEGLEAAQSEPFNLILLDLMLPGISGREICKALKGDSGTADIPIIMVTAKGEESDIVIGLELGADDYVVKPFNPKVLMARIKAVLRRKKISPEEEIAPTMKFDGLEVHRGKRELRIDGKPADLTYTEFQILLFLASKPGWVFTRYQIVDAVKGTDYPVTDRSVDVQIVGLRKKLGPYGKYIETMRGVGYRFSEKATGGEE
ncbi:MAG: response regulator transcription factor [candidate division Zixibacteria bacterium]|nr:response regulator transcription factor [candidate division Zixibacteria bacterium]